MGKRVREAIGRVWRRIFAPKPDPNTISPDTAAKLRERKPCQHCGGWHQRPEPSCYRIRRIAFTDAGNIHEIEYWPHGQWPTDHIVFPEDLPAEEIE